MIKSMTGFGQAQYEAEDSEEVLEAEESLEEEE